MTARRGFTVSVHDNLRLTPYLSYLFPLPLVEVPDIHMGWEDACALEETGKLQARAAKRYTSKRGDRPRAEGRGERRECRV